MTRQAHVHASIGSNSELRPLTAPATEDSLAMGTARRVGFLLACVSCFISGCTSRSEIAVIREVEVSGELARQLASDVSLVFSALKPSGEVHLLIASMPAPIADMWLKHRFAIHGPEDGPPFNRVLVPWEGGEGYLLFIGESGPTLRWRAMLRAGTSEYRWTGTVSASEPDWESALRASGVERIVGGSPRAWVSGEVPISTDDEVRFVRNPSGSVDLFTRVAR